MTSQSYPTSPGELPAAGAPPKDVRTAFLLWVTNLAMGLIGALLAFVLADGLVEAAARQAGTDLPPAAADSVRGTFTTNISLSVVAIIITAVVVIMMRNGKNWARIVLTVLGVLGVLVALIGFSNVSLLLAVGPIGVLSVVLSVIQIAVVVAAIVFMFRPGAVAYFKR